MTDDATLVERLHNVRCMGIEELCWEAGDRIFALEAENTALRERMTWRPIETAPKTFHPPLSIYNHHAPQILGLWGRAFYHVCSWGGPSNPAWIGDDNRPVPFQPKHWMPLPEPPGMETK